MCERTSFHLWFPSPWSNWGSTFFRASADRNDSMLKLSSPRLRCWTKQVFVYWLYDSACWKSCADLKGCHEFHYSEKWQRSLYNPVALPYACPLCCPLQQPAYQPSSLFDQGYKSDQASGVLTVLHGQYLQMVAYRVHCLWVDALVD